MTVPDPTGTSLAGIVAPPAVDSEEPLPDSDDLEPASSVPHAEMSPTVPTAPAEVMIVRLLASTVLSSSRFPDARPA